jgi:hypothetical protein
MAAAKETCVARFLDEGEAPVVLTNTGGVPLGHP